LRLKGFGESDLLFDLDLANLTLNLMMADYLR